MELDFKGIYLVVKVNKDCSFGDRYINSDF